MLALEQIFLLIPIGGLQAVDPWLQVDDVIAHGHLRSILSFNPATYCRRLNAGLTVAVNPL